MLVREIMTLGVQTINSDAPITDAARKMRDLDVGLLPVRDGHRLVGAISDRDIVLRGIACDIKPLKCSVGDIMTPGPVVCYESQPVHEAAELMRKQRIRRLFVPGLFGPEGWAKRTLDPEMAQTVHSTYGG